MRRLVALMVLVFLLAVASASGQTTTLLTPDGRLVGGTWQRWLNRSYAPTYAGEMILDQHMKEAACDRPFPANACSADKRFTAVVAGAPPQLAAMPETGIDMSAALGSGQRYLHYLLMYEQGHIVDFRYLTNRQRAAFMRLWHMSIPAGDTVSEAWWAGESSRTLVHDERVPGERFSDSYAMCALVRHWSVKVANAYTWTAFSPVLGIAVSPVIRRNGQWVNGKLTRGQRRTVLTQQRSCRMIRQIRATVTAQRGRRSRPVTG